MLTKEQVQEHLKNPSCRVRYFFLAGYVEVHVNGASLGQMNMADFLEIRKANIIVYDGQPSYNFKYQAYKAA